MARRTRDFVWNTDQGVGAAPRHLLVHDELRYAQGASQSEIDLDGFLNYHWLLSPAELGRPKVMLEAGINAPSEVSAPDGLRRPLIAIRSSPWKAGHESNPWHDEFDLDHGHVRYFGDHKPSTIGLPGATKGNRLLLDAAQLHSGTTRAERVQAPPLLLFRAITVHRDGRAIQAGPDRDHRRPVPPGAHLGWNARLDGPANGPSELRRRPAGAAELDRR